MIDTNVIVTGLRSQKGAAFRVLRGVSSGLINPVVSQALFLEYEDVLMRPGMLPSHMPHQAVDRFLSAFLLASELQEIFFMWRPSLPDPQDEFVLELAVASGCIPIITNNLKDFLPASKFGVKVMTPRELLSKLNPTE